MPKKFKSPIVNYVVGEFKTTKHPHSPSPKRKDYEKRAVTSDDGKSRCTYIHPQTGKRCLNKLEVYPEYCKMHTMMIQNVYIAPSQIEKGGNGLFVGPYGFKKGDIIGKYNYPWNEVKLETLKNRCKNKNCWSYVFCDDEDENDSMCWDGLDIRSTLLRNANDAYGSQFHNNAYFENVKGDVLVIASRNIKPKSEIFVDYGSKYW